ncbi:MAG: hypothetical protein ABI846_06020 [Rudaea sp.]
MHASKSFFLCAALCVSPALQAAAPPQRIETITAQVHAEMANHAETIASMHAHFHHVINCIVDPDNKLFDLRAGNPCASMGSSGGAMRDEASSEGQKKLLAHALDIARRGAAARSMDVARVYAEWLSDVLKQATP